MPYFTVYRAHHLRIFISFVSGCVLYMVAVTVSSFSFKSKVLFHRQNILIPCGPLVLLIPNHCECNNEIEQQTGLPNHERLVNIGLRQHLTNYQGSFNQQKDQGVMYQFWGNAAIPKAFTIQEVKDGTEKDNPLQCLPAAIPWNHWEWGIIKKFRSVHNELMIGAQNLILHDTRLVIPSSLQ